MGNLLGALNTVGLITPGNPTWRVRAPRPAGDRVAALRAAEVLLIDEQDKSDIDLPDDLLNVFEDGEFEIQELMRIAGRHPEVKVLTDDRDGDAVVRRGRVRCRAFPIVIITSNGEREFPAPFLRRCLKLHVDPSTPQQLGAMVAAQFGDTDGIERVNVARLIADFTVRSDATGGLASDQLLNAVHLAVELATSGAYQPDEDWQEILTAIWHPLSSSITPPDTAGSGDRPASPEFYQVVDAIGAIPCMQGEHSRSLVVEQLWFAGSVRYLANRRAHVTSILRTCLDFEDGVVQLVIAISGQEPSGSMPVNRLLALLTGVV